MQKTVKFFILALALLFSSDYVFGVVTETVALHSQTAIPQTDQSHRRVPATLFSKGGMPIEEFYALIETDLMTAANKALGLLGGDSLCTVKQFALLCLSYGFLFFGKDQASASLDHKALMEEYEGWSLDRIRGKIIKDITGRDAVTNEDPLYCLLNCLHNSSVIAMEQRLAPRKTVFINDHFLYNPLLLSVSRVHSSRFDVIQAYNYVLQDGATTFQALFRRYNHLDSPVYALFNAALHAGTLDFRRVIDLRERYQQFYRYCMDTCEFNSQNLQDNELRVLIDMMPFLMPNHVVVIPCCDVFYSFKYDNMVSVKRAVFIESINPAIERFKDQSTRDGDCLYCIVNVAGSIDTGLVGEDAHWICVVFVRDSRVRAGFLVEVYDWLNTDYTWLPLYKTIVDQLNS